MDDFAHHLRNSQNMNNGVAAYNLIELRNNTMDIFLSISLSLSLYLPKEL